MDTSLEDAPTYTGRATLCVLSSEASRYFQGHLLLLPLSSPPTVYALIGKPAVDPPVMDRCCLPTRGSGNAEFFDVVLTDHPSSRTIPIDGVLATDTGDALGLARLSDFPNALGIDFSTSQMLVGDDSLPRLSRLFPDLLPLLKADPSILPILCTGPMSIYLPSPPI